MSWTVLKFGGSSLADAARVAHVAGLVAAQQAPIAVVVSAQGDTTDQLVHALELARTGQIRSAHAIVERLPRTDDDAAQILIDELRDLLLGVSLLRETSAATKDLVLSHGERLSVLALRDALETAGCPAVAVDARTWLWTDDAFGDARVDLDATYVAARAAAQDWVGIVPVITGFIGSTEDGRTTTLGRGGSDYTATLLGRALDAREVQIWTDVPGVFTADPAICEDARPLAHMTYGEALELAVFGARVLHPRTLVPLLGTGIPMRIKSTLDPHHPGTLVDEHGCTDSDRATSVTSLEDQALFDLRIQRRHDGAELGERVHRALREVDAHPWLVTHSAHGQGISVVVPREEAAALTHALQQGFARELARGDLAPIRAREPVALITVVGEAMGKTPGVAGRFLSAVGGAGINVLSVGQSASARSVSCVIDQRDLSRAVETVHEAFHFTAQRVSLFLLGAGTVGGALVQELTKRQGPLRRDQDLDLSLVGVRTSSKLAFDPEGIDVAQWRDHAREVAPSTPVPLHELAQLPVPVLVDCTAEEGMERLYAQALRQGIHVVVANKKALTTPQAVRDALFATARKHRTSFRYEATVGAALPVIGTLQDLLSTGDTIERIEGSLSGSLGFICDRLTQGAALHEAVTEAVERGYTEPRPQDDLAGTDAARKALILARELGLNLELDDVEVTPLVPSDVLAIHEPTQFLDALKNPRAATGLTDAPAPRKSLRYLAIIEPDATPALKVGPVWVDDTHPANRLGPGQSLVSFATRRYSIAPLVVQGAGAGGEVTASGVLADVLRIAHGRGAA